MAPPTSELARERRAQIIQALIAKEPVPEIATELRVTRQHVYNIARDIGLSLQAEKSVKARKDREAVATLAASGKRPREIAATLRMNPRTVQEHLMGIRGTSKRARHLNSDVKRLEIPQWVPAHMHEDYRLVAELDGEHAAAAWARGEKLGAA